MRVEVGVYPHDLDLAEARGDRTGRAIHDRVHVGPLKVITDGSLGTRTAYCHDPYPDGGRGLLEVPPEQLAAVLARGAAMGLRPAVHALGDAALTHALDVFEATGITLFVFTTQSLERLPIGTRQPLLDPGGSDQLIGRHLVQGLLPPSKLAGEHATLGGGTLEVTVDGEDVRVGPERVRVLCGNIATADGIVYLIGAPLGL